ncbi:MAG: hypothetical protein NC079_04670 [Clostridium sp.]|nr:hypothetical protein [Acetatifactor muris]MCM1526298.1 hypothetical protein [Bacteroides sp.]MCM1562885.1 hypothetical protein [Clostridium sp.]
MGVAISNFCKRVVRYLGILFTGYLFLQGLFTICCIRRVNEDIYFMRNNALRQLAGIALFFALTLFLTRGRVRAFLERNANRLTVLAVAGMTIFLTVWVANTRFWFAGDMEKIYQYAGMLSEGDYSGWTKGGYPYMYPHQNGLILFVAFLLRFCTVEESVFVLYGCNILFYVITLVSVLSCVRHCQRDGGVACVQGLMLICYLPYAFFCLLLYGNVIGFGFACAAMAAAVEYTRGHRAGWLVGSALCMAAAVIFKQNELILLVGILILLLFDCLTAAEKRAGKAALMLLWLTVALAGSKLPDAVMEGITGMEVGAGMGRFAHLAMGLQYTDVGDPGWYNGYNADIFEANDYDTRATTEAAIASLRESWAGFAEDPGEAWRFFNQKLAAEWNNPTFECFHIQNFKLPMRELGSVVSSAINDGGKINILLIALMDIWQSVLLFGILMYLISADEAGWAELLPALLFIGGFVFFAFWEAKSQYVAPFFFLLIPYAFPGYLALAKRAREPGKKRNGLFAGVAAVAVLAAVIALSDGGWVHDSFKIDADTEAYYEYIHEYDANFVRFRF